MKRKTQIFKIENFPWDEGGYKPETTVELSYDDDGFEVHFMTNETSLRMTETKNNTDIYCDSCMELYAQFVPESDLSYINFEINPNAAVFCSKSTCRENSKLIESDIIDTFGARTKVGDAGWEAWINIPINFIKKEFPSYEHKNGAAIKANFYKCGDKTGHIHFGCWKNIRWSEPDFHRPEFFGEIIL